MGIVEDIDIPVFEVPIGGRFFNYGLNCKGHHPNENRQAGFTLHQGIAIHRMIETMTGIMGLCNNRVEGCAEKSCVHLVRNLFHPSSEDGQCNWVNLSHVLAFVSAMSFQTSCRMSLPFTISKRSMNRISLKAVPLGHSPESVPRQ